MSKVLIIGSRAIGLFLNVYLNSAVEKYYLGKGFSFLNLKPFINILIKSNKTNYKIKKYSNIFKHDISSVNKYFEVCFIAVFEQDLPKTIKMYSEILQNANSIVVISNSVTSVRQLKSEYNLKNIYLGFIENGVKYISPELVYTITQIIRFRLIPISKNKEINGLEENPGIFNQKMIEFSSSNEIKYNEWVYLRYFKTAISLLSVIYKMNMFELLYQKLDEIKLISFELEQLLGTTGETEKQISSFLSNVSILNYYPSSFEAYYIRGKLVSFDNFFNDIFLISSNNSLRYLTSLKEDYITFNN